MAINEIVNKFLNIDSHTFIAGAITGIVTRGIGFLIIAIAIIWALFKTWMQLLSAYANIILGIIFSPLQLMMDAIPGQNQLSGWLRNMLSNLLAFPAVIVILLIGLSLADFSKVDTGISAGFTPPLIGSGDQQAMQALIGIAIILTMPKVLEIIQEVLKAPKNKWGNAWGEAVKWGGERTFDVGGYGARKGAQAVGATTWWSGVHGAYQGAGGGPRGLVQGAREAVRPIIK